MKRFQLVDALAWEKTICTVLIESHDDSILLNYQAALSTAMDQPLEIIDTSRERFPAKATPLFQSEHEVSQWLKRHEQAKKRNAGTAPAPEPQH
jgi:hypothetical protein